MDFKETIRVIEGFPIEGISYKDITTLIKDGDAFRAAVDEMASFIDGEADAIAGPEARGFIFGTALAYKLGIGFVPIRKPGKLPSSTVRYEYTLEYGTDALEIHTDSFAPGAKVVLVDDLLATGGTLLACAKLVELAGGKVLNIISLIELTELKGRDLLTRYNAKSLVAYPF
ncbi:MAG: adenine phosphoribosyltransferase [Eubacteriaceae bacterium]|jgi:adenine phosphoribosyltransferase|nr:adenine phosphoribosyltransferase [Eubacteriaceae bacterium]